MNREWTSDAARLVAVFTGFLVVAVVPVALAADSTPLRSQANALRAGSSSLEARAHAATLELYALEAELGQARAELERLTAQRTTLERDQALTRKQHAIARKALRVSQARVAELVRALYEQPGHSSDPLAILLGAESLEEALTGLDSLSRAAGENNRIVEQARGAQTRLVALDARLSARESELSGLVAAAKARTGQLEGAAAERSRFVAGLRRQQGLNAARITAIETHARTAESRSAELSPAPAPLAEPTAAAVPVRALAAGRTLTVSSTGYALRGNTATGIPTGPGVVAVDPSVIPLGTRLTIPGYGAGVAADTGGNVHGNVIDVWFPTRQQALAWGRRTVTITLG
ncbi:MAG TPA: 3D domain-containing protein [Gaiellaceae bacterium]